MSHHPLLSFRCATGLTSVPYLGRRVLTTSCCGELLEWDRETSNCVSSWKPKSDLSFALRLPTSGSAPYGVLALQHKGGVSLFDARRGALTGEVSVDYSSFARICVASLSPSVLLIPRGIDGILCHDLRVGAPPQGSSALGADRWSFGDKSVAIAPPTTCSSASSVGFLQNIEPLPSLGAHAFVSSYECGLVCVFDLRRAEAPLHSATVPPAADSLPSLAVWRSVVLVGDSEGVVSMFNACGSRGLVLLSSASIFGYAPRSGVGRLAVRCDGGVTVACCWDYSVRVLETRSLCVKCVLHEHRDSLTDVVFDVLTGEFATCGLDGNAHVWSVFSDVYERPAAGV